MDENLAKSLENVADFFAEEAEFIERVHAGGAHCLPRSSGKRNDNVSRTKVRALAKINQSIFGECMYGTLVTMAESLLNCKIDKDTLDELEKSADLRAHLEGYAALPAVLIKAYGGDEFMPIDSLAKGGKQ